MEEAYANIPVSSLHLQAHPMAVCVCQTVPDKPRAQRQEWTQALVPWAQSGCVTEPRLWLAPHRVGFGAGTVSCHRSGGRVSQQGSSVGRGEGDKPQSPAPFGTSAWCCCSREPSSTSPCKRGAPLTCRPRARSVSSRHVPRPGAGVRTSRLAQSSLKGY